MKSPNNFPVLFLFCSLAVFGLHAQTPDSLHLKTVGHWDDNTLPLRFGLAYNDVWGYTDSTGAEYAIIGTVEKVFFYKIDSASGSLTYVDEVAGGTQSLWRDIKTYDHYAYAVADEHSEGLMIIDLQYLPDSVHLSLQTTSFFNRSHNIFIDTAQAKLYAVGNVSPTGNVVILDLSTPDNPTQLAEPALSGGYAHDLYVIKDTAYCNHGNNGLYVYDMSTPASPVLLGSLTSYPQSGYNHACWRNEAGTHLAFTDETHNKGVKLADVSDLTNIFVTDVFRSALLAPADTASIAHNPIIKGDSLYLSYYHDGIQVFNIFNPDSVYRVAYYDTYPTNTDYSGYDGAWGVYPLLPSGRILGSDILNGLYVLEFYQAPMPVELSSFEGKVLPEGHLLSWTTETETNSSFFELQRSPDALHFAQLTRVEAAGNSSFPLAYSWLDKDAPAGDTYYRLKVVDEDGSSAYSGVLHLAKAHSEKICISPVLLLAGTDVLRLYGPSLAEEYLKGRFPYIALYDLYGHLLKRYELRDFDFTGNELWLHLPVLGNGCYVLRVGEESLRFVVQP